MTNERIEETTVMKSANPTHVVRKAKIVENSSTKPQIVEETVDEGPEGITKKKTIQPAIRTEHPQSVYETKKTIFRTYQFVWYVLSVIEILLGFRISLKALGANPFSGFTNLIYVITNPLALPFSGILPTVVNGSNVYEWSTIIAALVYLLLAFAIVYLFQFIKPVTPEEVEEKVDNT